MECRAGPKNLRTAAPVLLFLRRIGRGDHGWPKRRGADDRFADRHTLIRLANSCDRAAARTGAASASLSDLDEEDYRTIARILRTLADG